MIAEMLRDSEQSGSRAEPTFGIRFRTADGIDLPAVTAEQMREVDRIAVEDFGLSLLQMMENAGRNLAMLAMEMLRGARQPVAILAGGGGNGGGGLCCARHLHNRGYPVSVVLSKEPQKLGDAATNQLHILREAGVRPIEQSGVVEALASAHLVIDALIGYGLHSAPRGRTAELIELCDRQSARIISLDLPSGLDATSGETPGAVVRPERTLVLALPKTGLHSAAGSLWLADIGIPPEVYERIGLSTGLAFGSRYVVEMVREEQATPLAGRDTHRGNVRSGG